MSSSLLPASAANKICARLSLRAGCLPPLRSSGEFVTLGLVQLHAIAYIHPRLLFLEAQMIPMSNVNRSPPGPSFTPKQGQYRAFIYAYTRVQGRPPAEAELQRYFRVSPPSVHQMILTLERAGLIRRQPGVARSIKVLVAPENLPVLR
jgi:LexA DNA binding domain